MYVIVLMMRMHQMGVAEPVELVGIGRGESAVDLEDRDAEVDMNVVMTERGEYVEVQGSGEEAVFTAEEMAQMLALASKGIADITAAQKEAITAMYEKFGAAMEAWNIPNLKQN